MISPIPPPSGPRKASIKARGQKSEAFKRHGVNLIGIGIVTSMAIPALGQNTGDNTTSNAAAIPVVYVYAGTSAGVRPVFDVNDPPGDDARSRIFTLT